MIWIHQLSEHAGKEVELRGWLANKRSSGKIGFLQVRDGSGRVQAVVSRSEVSDESWQAVQTVTQESTLRVRGTVHRDDRAPGGVELHATEVAVLHPSAEFPITKKEHGVAFLMEHRHLWLRSPKQRACLRGRSEVC